MQEVKVSTLGFENLIAMYKEDVDFKDIYVSCEIQLPITKSSG